MHHWIDSCSRLEVTLISNVSSRSIYLREGIVPAEESDPVFKEAQNCWERADVLDIAMTISIVDLV